MQRVALAKRCFAEPGPYQTPAPVTAPALQRTAPRSAARCAASGARKSAVHELVNVYPIPGYRTSLILLVSCPVRGRFLEATPQRTERKLAGPGRPGTVDGLVVGGALGGAAPSLGRARCVAARGGYVNPASKGARWCPGASHRSIPSRGSRGIGKPRTLCVARTRKCGCLKIESNNFVGCETNTPPSSSRKRGPIHAAGREADGVSDSRNQPAKL
jgi:hypothetical protein